MKSYFHLLILCLISTQSLSQKIIELGPIEKPKKSDPYFEEFYGNKLFFKLSGKTYLIDNSNNTKVFENEVAASDFRILKSFRIGDSIINFTFIQNYNVSNYNCSFGIQTINAETNKAIDENKIIATHKFQDPQQYRSVQFEKTNDGFVLVELSKEVGTVTFFSNSYEVVSKLNVNKNILAEIDCYECYVIDVNEDHSVIIHPRTMKTKDVTNKFIYVLPNREEITFHKFPFVLNEPHTLFEYKYAYDNDLQIINCAYTITKNETNECGVGIYSMNLMNERVTNRTHYIKYNDVLKDNALLETYSKYLQNKKKQVIDNYYAKLEYFIHEGFHYIIIKTPILSDELSSAIYLMQLNKEGEMNWITPIISGMNYKFENLYVYPYVKTGKIGALIADYSSNSDNGEHYLNSLSLEKGPISFFNLELNVKDGSVISNKKLDLVIEEKDLFNKIITNTTDKQAIIEVIKDSKLYFEIITF